MRLCLAVFLLLYCVHDAAGLFDAHYADAVEKFRTRNDRVDNIVSLFADMLDEVVQKEKNDLILIKGYDKKGNPIHMKGVSKSVAELLEEYLFVGREDRARQSEMHEELITDILIPMIHEREKVYESMKQFDLLRAELSDENTFADFQAGKTQLMTVMFIEKYLKRSLNSLVHIGEVARIDLQEREEYSEQRKWIMTEISEQLELETGERLDIQRMKDILP